MNGEVLAIHGLQREKGRNKDGPHFDIFCKCSTLEIWPTVAGRTQGGEGLSENSCFRRCCYIFEVFKMFGMVQSAPISSSTSHSELTERPKT